MLIDVERAVVASKIATSTYLQATVRSKISLIIAFNSVSFFGD
jgi:hypothetical protein